MNLHCIIAFQRKGLFAPLALALGCLILPSGCATTGSKPKPAETNPHHFDERLLRESEARYRDSVRANPGDPNTHIRLGTFLFYDKGDYKGAEKEFKSILKLKPDSFTIYRTRFHLAELYEKEWKYADAKKEHEAMVRLKLKLQDPEIHFHYAWFLFRWGQDKEAEKEMREALRLLPNNHWVLQDLATWLDLQGRRKEARGYWEKALEVEELPKEIEKIKQRLAEPD